MTEQMTDRDLLKMAAEHFIFLKRLAESPGPIRSGGKIVGKYQTIAFECQAARDKIVAHLRAVG